MKYSIGFRTSALRKVLSPERRSVYQVARKSGIGADDRQDAAAFLIESDVAVHPVGPQMGVLLRAKRLALGMCCISATVVPSGRYAIAAAGVDCRGDTGAHAEQSSPALRFPECARDDGEPGDNAASQEWLSWAVCYPIVTSSFLPRALATRSSVLTEGLPLTGFSRR